MHGETVKFTTSIFYPVDGGSMFFRNFSKFVLRHTVTHRRWQYFANSKHSGMWHRVSGSRLSEGSCSIHLQGFLEKLGSTRGLRNVRDYSTIQRNIARRFECLAEPLWEPQISCKLITYRTFCTGRYHHFKLILIWTSPLQGNVLDYITLCPNPNSPTKHGKNVY